MTNWWKTVSKISKSYYYLSYKIVSEVVYISYAFLNLINTKLLGKHKNISESLILVRFQYIICNHSFNLSWTKIVFALKIQSLIY